MTLEPRHHRRGCPCVHRDVERHASSRRRAGRIEQRVAGFLFVGSVRSVTTPTISIHGPGGLPSVRHLADVAAHRFLAAEIVVHERLIDDRHVAGRGAVGLGERRPATSGASKRLEVVDADGSGMEERPSPAPPAAAPSISTNISRKFMPGSRVAVVTPATPGSAESRRANSA